MKVTEHFYETTLRPLTEAEKQILRLHDQLERKFMGSNTYDFELGKIAYDAYKGQSNGKSLITGTDLPEFKDLKEEIRIAWAVAGRAAKCA